MKMKWLIMLYKMNKYAKRENEYKCIILDMFVIKITKHKMLHFLVDMFPLRRLIAETFKILKDSIKLVTKTGMSKFVEN